MKRTKVNLDYLQETEELARYAKALGHPTRIKIIKILALEQFCYTGDLVDLLPIAQSTISQHLKELKSAGLIQGEILPPKIKYCLNRENWLRARTLFNEFLGVEIEGFSCKS